MTDSAHSPPLVVVEARRLVAGYNGRPVLEDVSLSIEAGTITALVGPNGSGKSTLLRALSRLLKPHDGAVWLDGKDIASLSTSLVARKLAVLPQGPSTPEGLTVAELVEQGRFPHVGALRMLRRQDHQATRDAIQMCGMSDMADRHLDTLSGGERQRAWIALALAQETPVLLLDEPTTFLDIAHQLEVMQVIARLNQEREMTIVMVVHDLNQAARFADRIIALHQGAIVADGAPEEVLTPDRVERIFGVSGHVVEDPGSGRPVFLPQNLVTPARPGD